MISSFATAISDFGIACSIANAMVRLITRNMALAPRPHRPDPNPKP